VAPVLDRPERAGEPGREQESLSVSAEDQDGRIRARDGGKVRVAAERAENVAIGSARINAHLHPSRFFVHLHRRRAKN
jgi:hypothetical protein